MSDIAVADIRNIALMGHTGSGKTSLVDALLDHKGISGRGRRYRFFYAFKRSIRRNRQCLGKGIDA